MCIFPKTPMPPAPKMPKETAAMNQPDAGKVVNAQQRRATDKVRAYTPTVLTGGQGALPAPLEKKTLLGQ